jgi:hypothetical protein
MKAPDWLLPRPPFDMSPEKQRAFEDLWKLKSKGDLIDYSLPYPKWQFLTHLCDTKELVLHGSQNHDIDIVEPRQANDIRAYSNQRAIYATTDGIWVIYFAILDRKKFPQLSLFNSCLRARISANQFSDPVYFFSITHSVLLKKPWCDGMVYILPRQSFEREASQQMQGVEIVFPHWISSVAAEPAAKLMVGPQDFPFLSRIHGHDNVKLNQLAMADPNGYPWSDALES